MKIDSLLSPQEIAGLCDKRKNMLSARRLRFGKDTKEVKRSLYFFLWFFTLFTLKSSCKKLNKTSKSSSAWLRGLNNSVQSVFMNVVAEENRKIPGSMLNVSGYLLLLCWSLHFAVHNVLGTIVSIWIVYVSYYLSRYHYMMMCSGSDQC